MKKGVVLIQPNYQQGPKENNAYYLPYSVGVIWSYVNQFQDIKENFVVTDIIWRREKPDLLADRLANDDIFLFSCYVWNKNYIYALAKLIKEKNPNSILIFGGPEIPVTSSSLFDDYPFMDIVVEGEGEHTFADVLRNLITNDFKVNSSLTDVKGLVLPKIGGIITTGKRERVSCLDDIPSPYTSGVFDSIVNDPDNAHIEWNITIETNRGCPYKCTFCDWGSMTYSKIKKFDVARVQTEIHWGSEHRCGHMTVTDANYGIFPDRDSEIADYIIDAYQTTGFPYSIGITWAKNQKAVVVDIMKRFVSGIKLNSGLTVSVQSMTDAVLDNIERTNLNEHKISEIFSLCEKENIPVYTEVILGLPGETPSSWKQTLWTLFEAGNHTGINILQAQLLENAPMNLHQVEEFGLESTPTYDYMIGSYDDDANIDECVDVVTGTKDMPHNEMVEIHVFNWFINCFHISGLSTFVARILHDRHGISYGDFYDGLYTHLIKNNEWFHATTDEMRNIYKSWAKTGRVAHPDIGSVKINGLNLIYTGILRMHNDDRVVDIIDDIKEYVHSTFEYVPDDEVNQLIDFQKTYIVNYDDVSNYPMVKNYDYDIIGSLVNGTTYENNVTIQFSFKEQGDMSKQRFIENFWFGRKRNFGKTSVEVIVNEK